MDELIKMVTDRVGIPQDKARAAVELVVSQLKNQLPAPLAGQVESALAGGGSGGLGSILGGSSKSGSAGQRQ